MILLGLTGSIGMGKSTTTAMFADLGAVVWNADDAVHRLYASGGAAVAPVGDAFPGVVVGGEVDRTRLAQALARENADIAIAAAREEDGQVRAQPVFCLMATSLFESLAAFTSSGGRKIDAWTALHKTVTVPFDAPGDEARAFFNANTLAELHHLESQQP